MQLVGIAPTVSLVYGIVANTDGVGDRATDGGDTVSVVGGAVADNTARASDVMTSCLLLLGVRTLLL